MREVLAAQFIECLLFTRDVNEARTLEAEAEARALEAKAEATQFWL